VSSSESRPPLVLVTVGSDHHPFDRLVDWIDAWLRTRPPGSVRCVMQYGTSHPPTVAEGKDFFPSDDLQALMAEAAVVVTQGGPMGVFEARDNGAVPIVVPRSHELGEHVDNHQQAFGRKLAADGMVHVPGTSAELAQLIDAALSDPASFTAVADAEAQERVDTTTARLGEIVDQLTSHRRSPTVLLISGSGRSGSTLFERALGDVPGVTALGETVHLWERGLRDDELCGCGEPFSHCPFWSEVGKRAFGGWETLDADEMVRLRFEVVRTRYLGRLTVASPDVGYRLDRDRLARLTGALYRTAAEVTGARLVVDSSKMPAYAALIHRADVDLRCAYVVRDPRGVAHSWAKTVARPEGVDGSSDMPRYGAATSSLWWSAFDVAFRYLKAVGIPTTTVRYEDFVRDPRGSVDATLRFAGVSVGADDLAHLTEKRVELRPTHLVAGNPMRFTSGPIDVVMDEAWRRDLPARDARIVSALTAGLRHRHGYR